MRASPAWAAAALLWLPLAARAAKPLPPPPRSYVLNEGVVSDAAAERLSRRLADFERATGHQFVVALFQSLDGENLEDYSNKLFRAWKIGDAKRDDGLLFCVFLKDRRWRVEVGYGLEGTLTDLEAAEIANRAAVPPFRAGDFDGGVLAVTDALARKLSGEAAAPEPVAAPSRGRSAEDLYDRYYPALQGVGLFVLAFYFVFWATYERGFHWGLDVWTIGRKAEAPSRYPARVLVILGLYLLLLLRILFYILEVLASGSSGSGGSGGDSGGGGFSGGGGSSGGGGASGSW